MLSGASHKSQPPHFRPLNQNLQTADNLVASEVAGAEVFYTKGNRKALVAWVLRDSDAAFIYLRGHRGINLPPLGDITRYS